MRLSKGEEVKFFRFWCREGEGVGEWMGVRDLGLEVAAVVGILLK